MAGSNYEERVNKYYSKNYEAWRIIDDIDDEDRTVTIIHVWNSPTYSFKYEEDLPTYMTGGVSWRRYYPSYPYNRPNNDYTSRDIFRTYNNYNLGYPFYRNYYNSYSFGYIRNYW